MNVRVCEVTEVILCSNPNHSIEIILINVN